MIDSQQLTIKANIKNNDGDTPLHCAMVFFRDDALLMWAQENHVDMKRRRLAERERRKEVPELLRHHGGRK